MMRVAALLSAMGLVGAARVRMTDDLLARAGVSNQANMTGGAQFEGLSSESSELDSTVKHKPGEHKEQVALDGRPWYYIPAWNGAPVRCSGLDKLECAADDGANCKWGTYGQRFQPYEVMPGVTAAKPLVLACPTTWSANTRDGSDACAKLGCYAPGLLPNGGPYTTDGSKARPYFLGFASLPNFFGKVCQSGKGWETSNTAGFCYQTASYVFTGNNELAYWAPSCANLLTFYCGVKPTTTVQTTVAPTTTTTVATTTTTTTTTTKATTTVATTTPTTTTVATTTTTKATTTVTTTTVTTTTVATTTLATTTKATTSVAKMTTKGNSAASKDDETEFKEDSGNIPDQSNCLDVNSASYKDLRNSGIMNRSTALKVVTARRCPFKDGAELAAKIQSIPNGQSVLSAVEPLIKSGKLCIGCDGAGGALDINKVPIQDLVTQLGLDAAAATAANKAMECKFTSFDDFKQRVGGNSYSGLASSVVNFLVMRTWFTSGALCHIAGA